MNSRTANHFCTFLTVSLLGAAATQGVAQSGPSLADDPTAFRAPIHTQADDPVGGAYGIWASGDAYKVSFHDGLAFYPVVGADQPHSQPLRWRTQTARRGGTTILSEAATQQFDTWNSDWRFEYRYGPITEAYDVRPEGVEQTFVLTAPPAGAGDLVITGRIDSQLRANDRAGAHDAVHYCDNRGTERVRLGAATAVDGRGDRLAMKTSIEGDLVRYTVPSAWLDAATYPIVVDPLLSAQGISTSFAGYRADYVAIGLDNERIFLSDHGVMVVYSRLVSGNDQDVYARLLRHDWTAGATVFTDLSASWATVEPDVAFIGGPDRWAIAFERDLFSINRSAVRVYLHDANDLNANSGSLRFVSLPIGETHTRPAIGGTALYTLRDGDHGLLVYQRDLGTNPAQSATTSIYSVIVDAATETLGNATRLRSGLVINTDQERPQVTDSMDEDEPWVVVFQEFDPAILLGHWNIVAMQIDHDGNLLDEVTLDQLPGRLPRQAIEPQVAGNAGNFLVTALRSDSYSSHSSSGSELVAQRLNWNAGGRASFGPVRQVATSATGRLNNLGLAFDTISDTHWGAVYADATVGAGGVLARLGATGAIVEQHGLGAGANVRAADVAYTAYQQKFLAAWATNGATYPIAGVAMVHDATGGFDRYGVGCGNGEIAMTSPYAWAGSETLSCRMFYAASSTPAVLLLSLAQANTPLDPIGMTGCVLNVDLGPGMAATFPGVTNGYGDIWQDLPIGDQPLFIGDLYLQWAYLDPTAPRPLAMSTSEGMELRIRL